MSTQYKDIISHPHHVSRNHPQMPMRDRAAQFSPFAALTGYEEAIRATVRAQNGQDETERAESHKLAEKQRRSE